MPHHLFVVSVNFEDSADYDVRAVFETKLAADQFAERLEYREQAKCLIERCTLDSVQQGYILSQYDEPSSQRTT